MVRVSTSFTHPRLYSLQTTPFSSGGSTMGTVRTVVLMRQMTPWPWGLVSCDSILRWRARGGPSCVCCSLTLRQPQGLRTDFLGRGGSWVLPTPSGVA